ncbi:asparagine synthase-domain-containing protein [Mycena floridula]|nr:asparagine synthase-domain-containing protein [Mycena floridula]
MCGIVFCARSLASTRCQDTFQRLCTANALRGPDAQETYWTQAGALDLGFFASELRLRGNEPVTQPHRRDGNVLCWNGEIFEGLNIHPHENDGTRLFDALCNCDTAKQLQALFESLEGPYAFVFYHMASQCLFFARDPLGRRSLLLHKPTPTNAYIFLASVSSGIDTAYSFTEVDSDGIFCLHLDQGADMVTDFDRCLSVMSYPEKPRVNSALPPDDWPLAECLDIIPPWMETAVEEMISKLEHSVRLRVQHIANSRVAVLFSGGIDSTVIAALAHRQLPEDEPIDLLSVAFENPRKLKIQREGNAGGPTNRKNRAKKDSETVSECSYLVPDRVTGLSEVAELRRLYPSRVWNFVEINVPYEVSQAARFTLEALLLPSNTVMDLSLGLALFFASGKEEGQIRNSDGSRVKYTSPAHVLLSGLGSDELFGGYGRHRTVFSTGGWASVIDELQTEIVRIPTRNLGRDDRTISSNGKETRHPFLSLNFVSWVARLPIQIKMDPRLPLGLGDKMILRFAANKMGLVEASCRKKRAMQFGSHSARMEGERRGDVPLE